MDQKRLRKLTIGLLLLAVTVFLSLHGNRIFAAELGFSSDASDAQEVVMEDPLHADTAVNYYVYYDADGGATELGQTSGLVASVQSGQSLKQAGCSMVNVYKEGYVFKGWKFVRTNGTIADLSFDENTEIVDDLKYNGVVDSANQITVRAQWEEPNDATVSIIVPYPGSVTVKKWDNTIQTITNKDSNKKAKTVSFPVDEGCTLTLTSNVVSAYKARPTGWSWIYANETIGEDMFMALDIYNPTATEITYKVTSADVNEGGLQIFANYVYAQKFFMDPSSTNKTTYLDGDIFDTEGLVTRLNYMVANPDDPDNSVENYQLISPETYNYDLIVPDTPLTIGTTKVTVSLNYAGTTLTTEQAVTVTPRPVNRITLNKTKADVNVGKTVTLTPTVMAEDLTKVPTDTSVTWKSSDPGIAFVSQKGVVKGVAVGTATITCTANDGSGVYATCAITVPEVKVSSITLDKSSANVLIGKTITLTPTLTPSNATNTAYSWASTNKDVAFVSSKGVVKGVSAGTATITCTAKDGSGASAVCTIIVKRPVTKITLNKTSASVLKGNKLTLIATVAPSNAANKNVTWKSSNTDVVFVSQQGVIKGVAVGTATITCTAKDGSGVKATCKVTVKQPVTKIKLSKTNAKLFLSEKLTLTATVAPSSAANRNVTWKSSNTNVATVSSSGVVTAKKVGTATITCTAKDGSGVKATCKITVAKPVKVIALNKTKASLAVGKKLTLKATVNPTDATNKNVTWSSSNTSVATVSSSGVVTAKKAGTVTITCKAKDGSGVKATCKITVK